MTWQAVTDALPVILPAAAGGALVVALVVVAARLGRRRPVGTPLPALRSDVAELASQLEDYARQIDRQVAQRLDRLEGLLAQADSRQQELRRLLELATKAAEDNPPCPRAADDQVVALASQGLDSVEIARRLRMGVGEVELILNLHRSHVPPRP
ncbi:MAG: hypothetical protein MUP47_00510 [Phycisphaerae bacterium]|nr:hypothetical protein [Phycisphaerae bacterium]